MLDRCAWPRLPGIGVISDEETRDSLASKTPGEHLSNWCALRLRARQSPARSVFQGPKLQQFQRLSQSGSLERVGNNLTAIAPSWRKGCG